MGGKRPDALLLSVRASREHEMTCGNVGSVISYESQFSVERRLKQNDVSIAGVLWVNV